jgi:hypothetical protein
MATKKSDVERAERAALALRLRASGAGYDAIGRQLGVSTPTAWRCVQAALDEIRSEPAPELIELECARLDRMLVAIWPLAIGHTETLPSGREKRHAPSVEAIDRVLKIMQRRARMLGLDAPTKKEISGNVLMRGAVEKAAEAHGLDPKEVLAQAEKLFRELSE